MPQTGTTVEQEAADLVNASPQISGECDQGEEARRGATAAVALSDTRLCQEKGLQPEWQPLLNDLDRLQEATIEKDGKVITTRTHVSGQVGNVFKAAGIALPASIKELSLQTGPFTSSPHHIEM